MDRNILYLGGCWTPNIGNAFIDIGAMYILKKIFSNDNIIFSSEIPSWISCKKQIEYDKIFDISSFIKADLVVYSGMCMCNDFIEKVAPTIIRQVKKDVRYMILGGGGLFYDDEEISKYSKFLSDYPPYVFVSRDQLAYKYYNKYSKHSYNGIDCVFFLNKAFKPSKLYIDNYDIINFDSDRTNFKYKRNKKVINSHHNFYYRSPSNLCNENNIFVSDIPDDYLNLYYNADNIYTDRIHTAISGLIFKKRVRLFTKSKRHVLFNSLKCYDILRKPQLLDFKFLEKKQREEINYLTNIYRNNNI